MSAGGVLLSRRDQPVQQDWRQDRGDEAGRGRHRIDALAAQLDELKAKGITPKFIYTIPTIQNPTGSILPLDRRHALLKLAQEYNVAIFEDECYADLLWQGVEAPPALYALAPDAVMHIGSFSKSLAPALRLGYGDRAMAGAARLIADEGR